MAFYFPHLETSLHDIQIRVTKLLFMTVSVWTASSKPVATILPISFLKFALHNEISYFTFKCNGENTSIHILILLSVLCQIIFILAFFNIHLIIHTGEFMIFLRCNSSFNYTRQFWFPT